MVHCTPAGDGGRCTIVAERSDGQLLVRASVPLDWLPRVWGPGLSEPDGRFVLAVGSRVGVDAFEVEVAEWVADGAARWEVEPRPARLARDGDGTWRVLARD